MVQNQKKFKSSTLAHNFFSILRKVHLRPYTAFDFFEKGLQPFGFSPFSKKPQAVYKGLKFVLSSAIKKSCYVLSEHRVSNKDC